MGEKRQREEKRDVEREERGRVGEEREVLVGRAREERGREGREREVLVE